MTSTPHIYGMLYVGEAGERHVNLAAGAPDPLAVYVRNAATLAASGRAAGMEVALITNRPERIVQLLAAQGLAGAVEVVEHHFTRDVPAGIPFRSAHFKLDVIQAFAAGTFGPVVALVDIDAVILRAFTLDRADAIYTYDIADQTLPAYGAERIARDLTGLTGRAGEPPRWFGGEFIAGHAAAFAPLAAEIERLWPAYVAGLGTYHHTGDEMIVTAAFTNLIAAGVPVIDAGAEGLVTRWWSGRTRSRIGSLDAALGCAVLHLPADKQFLSAEASRPFQLPAFSAALRGHARRERRSAVIKNIADLARLRAPQHLPRI